jgi:hypothetical protein
LCSAPASSRSMRSAKWHSAFRKLEPCAFSNVVSNASGRLLLGGVRSARKCSKPDTLNKKGGEKEEENFAFLPFHCWSTHSFYFFRAQKFSSYLNKPQFFLLGLGSWSFWLMSTRQKGLPKEDRIEGRARRHRARILVVGFEQTQF